MHRFNTTTTTTTTTTTIIIIIIIIIIINAQMHWSVIMLFCCTKVSFRVTAWTSSHSSMILTVCF